MLFFTERKASKELQAFGLTVGAIREYIPSAPSLRTTEGTQATAEHAERAVSMLRQLCTCGCELLSRTYSPHGECWLAERSESKQLLRAVCICFPAEAWEFEAVASMLPCNAGALHSTVT